MQGCQPASLVHMRAPEFATLGCTAPAGRVFQLEGGHEYNAGNESWGYNGEQIMRNRGRMFEPALLCLCEWYYRAEVYQLLHALHVPVGPGRQARRPATANIYLVLVLNRFLLVS